MSLVNAVSVKQIVAQTFIQATETSKMIEETNSDSVEKKSDRKSIHILTGMLL